MTAREPMRQFECRLASEPGCWRVVDAKSAADAAEAFAHLVEHTSNRWDCAQGAATMTVVVRSIADTSVTAAYRVLGRLVPAYTAKLLVPGEVA